MKHHGNWLCHTGLDFPRSGFWLVHVAGAIMLFVMGMRFGARRASLSMTAYRFFHSLMRGR